MILSRYERMVARRYLLPGKGEGFIFLVASISLVAVALGVAALIIVMSVMNGFRAELFDKIVGLNGHAVVQGYGGRLQDWRQILNDVEKTPGVTDAKRRGAPHQGALAVANAVALPLGVLAAVALPLPLAVSSAVALPLDVLAQCPHPVAQPGSFQIRGVFSFQT
jgi:hypothetical protein